MRITPFVALFTRAWIEITSSALNTVPQSVALFTRAWIEIAPLTLIVTVFCVALFTRAWIEMPVRYGRGSTCSRRPLYEGVD